MTDKVAKRALDHARKGGLDTVIIDTAGRLQVDDAIMAELADMKKTVSPIAVYGGNP